MGRRQFTIFMHQAVWYKLVLWFQSNGKIVVATNDERVVTIAQKTVVANITDTNRWQFIVHFKECIIFCLELPEYAC